MFDKLVGRVLVPGALVAMGAAFSKELRPVAKEAVKLGISAGNAVQAIASDLYERGQGLVAEARSELERSDRD